MSLNANGKLITLTMIKLIKIIKDNFKSCTAYYVLCVTMLFIIGCNDDAVPKPTGYFRIDLPDTAYHKVDMKGYPYNFEIPKYSVPTVPYFKNNPYPYWLNIDFKPFNATLYLSYRAIDNNLDTLLNDSWAFVMKHSSKSDGIESSNYINEERKIYGTMFTIDGMTNASPIQFYLLDSTRHFLRGALYFNTVPNNDSLKPVIERIKQDIQHLVETTNFQ